MVHFPIRDSSELKSGIESLDLTMPLMKCMDSDEGHGWSPEHARLVEREYKRFLYLTVTRSEAIVPTKEVDKLWHAHILDTRKYHKDCQELFGTFLHHFPYFGLRGEEDARNLSAAFEVTKEIWRSSFGDIPAFTGEDQMLASALCSGECSGNGGCSNCGSNGPDGDDIFPASINILPPAYAAL